MFCCSEMAEVCGEVRRGPWASFHGLFCSGSERASFPSGALSGLRGPPGPPGRPGPLGGSGASNQLGRLVVWGLLSLLIGACIAAQPPQPRSTIRTRGALRGLNLPPTQGTTYAGAFQPGVYNFDYTDADLARVRAAGFEALRLPINVATALDGPSLERLAGFFEAMGNRGIICFFDTREVGQGTHGDGRPGNLDLFVQAWAAVGRRFAHLPEIRFELFNEPFGYPRTPAGAREYLAHMRQVMEDAQLPVERCVLDGLGYADDLASVVRAGWEGELAYHFYPNWLADGERTQERVSNRVQQDLRGLGRRVTLTEFGANLGLGEQYELYTPDGSSASGDRNALRGLHDALRALRRAGEGVAGSFHWHGWHNGDSYDFLDEANWGGAAKVMAIQGDS